MILNAPNVRASRLAGLFDKATVVIFAGIGGVCIGVERAYVRGGFRDRYIDLAINHWDTAVGVHELNHPMTQHLHADVWEVDPNNVLQGRQIGYLHLSPDCTDFSKAKGDKPKRKHIRALADVGIVWARKRRPDVITLENVEEFEQWGDLTKRGKVHKGRRGVQFKRWVSELRALGYAVEWRCLRACDYGSPTTRKRLFVIARCDGKPIVWPEKTHGKTKTYVRDLPVEAISKASASDGYQGFCRRNSGHLQDLSGTPRHQSGTERAYRQVSGNGGSNRRGQCRLKPYRTAAECIDWSLPMLSIFATRPQARAWAAEINRDRAKWNRVGVPQRPLKPKTQQRMAGGLLKWVLDAEKPFIIQLENSNWGAPCRSVDQPLSTVTATPKGGKHALVDVETAGFTGTFNHGGHDYRTNDPRDPMGTVTAARDARGVVGVELSAFSIPRYGEREGQSPRSNSIDQPAPAVTATGNGTNLVAVALNKHFGGVIGQGVGKPIGTVTSVDHHSTLVAHLTTYHGKKGDETRGLSPDEPISTIDTQNRHGLITAHLVKFRGDSNGNAITDPMPTVTSGAGAARDAGAAHAMGVGAVYLSHNYTSNTNGGQGNPDKPHKTITGGAHHSSVCVVYLAPYYGNEKEGRPVIDPMPTVVSKDRMAFLSVDATPHWIFTPKALSRAREVARWARKWLGKKVEKHLLWVTDAAGKKFPLLMLALKGAIHIVTDIAMRMLRPRELARAQGFDDSYVIDRTVDGTRISKSDQVKLIGNSVCPDVAEAIAYCNVVLPGVLGNPPRRRQRRRELVIA